MVVAAPDEFVFGDKVAQQFKFFGETIGNKQDWLAFHIWRKGNRRKLPEPWSSHAVPKLTNGIRAPDIYGNIKAHNGGF